jgi:hypothetical protein
MPDDTLQNIGIDQFRKRIKEIRPGPNRIPIMPVVGIRRLAGVLAIFGHGRRTGYYDVHHSIHMADLPTEILEWFFDNHIVMTPRADVYYTPAPAGPQGDRVPNPNIDVLLINGTQVFVIELGCHHEVLLDADATQTSQVTEYKCMHCTWRYSIDHGD